MGDIMPIYALDEDCGFFGKVTELFWLTIMFMGFPIFNIFEWIHWEIYGEGPRKKK